MTFAGISKFLFWGRDTAPKATPAALPAGKPKAEASDSTAKPVSPELPADMPLDLHARPDTPESSARPGSPRRPEPAAVPASPIEPPPSPAAGKKVVLESPSWKDTLDRKERMAAHQRKKDGEPAVKMKRHHSKPLEARAAEPAGHAQPPRRSLSTPGPSEGWTLDSARPKREKDMPPTARAKYEEFLNLLSSGFHPKKAADILGDSKYTQLRGMGSNVYEVRLSGSHRVTFEQNKEGKSVRILDVGGHT